jgi:hypothetical protein
MHMNANQQNKDYFDELVESIKNIFPDNAEYETQYRGLQWICKVRWKLNNDHSRPNKLSTELRIIIPSENIDDYKNKSTERKEKSKIKLQQTIKNKYVDFDPEPNLMSEQQPPNEDSVVKL